MVGWFGGSSKRGSSLALHSFKLYIIIISYNDVCLSRTSHQQKNFSRNFRISSLQLSRRRFFTPHFFNIISIIGGLEVDQSFCKNTYFIIFWDILGGKTILLYCYDNTRHWFIIWYRSSDDLKDMVIRCYVWWCCPSLEPWSLIFIMTYISILYIHLLMGIIIQWDVLVNSLQRICIHLLMGIIIQWDGLVNSLQRTCKAIKTISGRDFWKIIAPDLIQNLFGLMIISDLAVTFYLNSINFFTDNYSSNVEIYSFFHLLLGCDLLRFQEGNNCR